MAGRQPGVCITLARCLPQAVELSTGYSAALAKWSNQPDLERRVLLLVELLLLSVPARPNLASAGRLETTRQQGLLGSLQRPYSHYRLFTPGGEAERNLRGDARPGLVTAVACSTPPPRHTYLLRQKGEI